MPAPTAPLLSDAERVRLLEPPRVRVPVVLDTDAANEIDDQFALAYLLLATDRVDLLAVTAAPFSGRGVDTPGDGMRASLDEIRRVLDVHGGPPSPAVLAGSERFMRSPADAVDSPAATDMIRRATADDGPLYVVAIGAPTTVASALVAAPHIAERIVVVWLGGNPLHWYPAMEFNVRQDLHASRVLLDSGVALVHVPCRGVTEQLRTTTAELDRYARPTGRLGGYLADLLERYHDDHVGRSKEIWDLGAALYVVAAQHTRSHLVHSPVLSVAGPDDGGVWGHDPRRHLVREVQWIDRDAVFRDLFRRLAAHAGT